MRIEVPKHQAPLERGELPPAEELLPLVYEELRRLAAAKMAQEASGQTLQPTALVHEAWLRLLDQRYPRSTATTEKGHEQDLAAWLRLVLTIHLTAAPTVGTAFTYQGRLSAGGNPANGVYDLTFALFDASVEGSGVGGLLTNSAAVISNGLFAVTLDFGGNVFSGAGLWLQIGVRTNGGGSFTILNPRQMLTSAPYAITAGNVTGPVNGASIVNGTITGAQLASNSIAASQLAPGAAAANLLASGQLGVPTGGVILSTNPNAVNLQSAGYSSPGEVHTADQWRPGNGAQAGHPVAGSCSMVWTGKEVLLWGGGPYGNGYYPLDGGRYNPSSDSWAAMSTNGAPAGRQSHTTVWTGSEMIVWGGITTSYSFCGDGGRYNPTNDTWSPVNASGAPSPRYGHAAVWTGK